MKGGSLVPAWDKCIGWPRQIAAGNNTQTVDTKQGTSIIGDPLQYYVIQEHHQNWTRNNAFFVLIVVKLNFVHGKCYWQYHRLSHIFLDCWKKKRCKFKLRSNNPLKDILYLAVHWLVRHHEKILGKSRLLNHYTDQTLLQDFSQFLMKILSSLAVWINCHRS